MKVARWFVAAAFVVGAALGFVARAAHGTRALSEAELPRASSAVVPDGYLKEVCRMCGEIRDDDECRAACGGDASVCAVETQWWCYDGDGGKRPGPHREPGVTEL